MISFVPFTAILYLFLEFNRLNAGSPHGFGKVWNLESLGLSSVVRASL